MTDSTEYVKKLPLNTEQFVFMTKMLIDEGERHRKVAEKSDQQHAEAMRELRNEKDALLEKLFEQRDAIIDHIHAIAAPTIYQYHTMENPAPNEVNAESAAGWELWNISDPVVANGKITRFYDFRKPVLAPTEPDTDETEAVIVEDDAPDLSAFECALDEDPNPNDTQEVEVAPEQPAEESDDGGETEPVVVPDVEPEREPAPVGYTSITVAEAHKGFSRYIGNLFAKKGKQYIAVSDVKENDPGILPVRDGKFVVEYRVYTTSHKAFDLMPASGTLYTRVESQGEPDSPTAIAPAPNRIITPVEGLMSTPNNLLVLTTERFPKVDIDTTLLIPECMGVTARNMAEAAINE